MKQISQIIQLLRDNPKSTVKLSILKEHASDELLKLAFYMAYEPSLNFWQQVKLSCYTGDGVLTTKILLDINRKVCNKELRGNEAKDYVKSVLESLTGPEAHVLEKIINRDMDCGVSISTINKVWPGLISEFGCMLSEKDSEKTRAKFLKALGGDKIIVQTKFDGGRCQYIAGKGGFSRAGNRLELHDTFEILDATFEGYVLDGELVAYDFLNDTPIDRKTSNGLFNKAVRGTITKDEAKSFAFFVWDLIPIEDFNSGRCDKSYQERYNKLKHLFQVYDAQFGLDNLCLSLASNDFVDTFEEVEELFSSAIARGEEGVMVKVPSAPWVNDRVATMIKMKGEEDCTLICTGTAPHSKKPGQIGSITCQTGDGVLEVSIGSGLTEQDRLQPPEFFIGKLIDVKYNMKIKAKGDKKPCLFLPIYRGIREDVEIADNFDKLK